MKVAFCTCVQLGLSCMNEIYSVGGSIDLVITLRDDLAVNKSGRVFVDDFCTDHDLPLLKIKNINDPEVIESLVKQDIDWLFIIGWSQIAHKTVLKTPRLGALGMHPTLLPVGRGRASIPWAIIKGLDETGVTLFQLDEGIDTGPILAQERIAITAQETAATLYEKVNDAHRQLLHSIWEDLVNNQIKLVCQDDKQATEWPGRTPDDGIILPSMTVLEADRLVRATTHPYPGAFWMKEGKKLRIWSGEMRAGKISRDDRWEMLELSDGNYYTNDYDWETDSH